jgi:predicted ArsR family transcriptional regulator
VETTRKGPAGETIDTSRHRALGSASRVEILRLVRAEPGLSAADVAARTGLHLNTARTHLDRLVDAGVLVKARASAGAPGRPAWRYRAVADDPAPAPYRSLAAALLENLGGPGGDSRAAAGKVGESWGRSLAASVPPAEPVAKMLTVLTGLGFDPVRQPADAAGPDTATVVHLRTCPFLDLVGQNPDAMCELHAGVVRGALRQAGEADGDVTLEPFGAPAACVVRLTTPPSRNSVAAPAPAGGTAGPSPAGGVTPGDGRP